MEELELEQWVTIFFLLFKLVDVTRIARIARIRTQIDVVVMVGLSKNERIISDLFKEFRLQAIANPLWVTGGVNSAAHRALLTRATRKFSRVHVSQIVEHSSGQDLWIAVVASHKSHSISSMFHRTLLDPPT